MEALLGRSPKDIMDGTVQRGMTLESIPTPPVIPAGVPSDLLERRPDIQQAEMSVKSANANIGHFADRPLRRGQPRTAYLDEQSAPDVELRRSGFRAAA